MLRLDIDAQSRMGIEIRDTVWKVAGISVRDAIRVQLDPAFIARGGIEVFRNFEIYCRMRPKRR